MIFVIIFREINRSVLITITRRSFIKKSVTVGVTSIFAGDFISNLIEKSAVSTSLPNEKVDLSIVKGYNYFDNTIKAVNQLGEVKNFVSKNYHVGILVNYTHSNPGYHLKPEIVLAVEKMCYDTGTKY